MSSNPVCHPSTFNSFEDCQAILSFASSVERQVNQDDPDSKGMLYELATRISVSSLPGQYPFLADLLKTVSQYLKNKEDKEIKLTILSQVECIIKNKN